jgi:maltooligosyltrehalose trehalohydrolase
MWLRDYYFNGLRLDVVDAILDTNAFPFLEQLGAEVRQLAAELRRPLMLIAESDHNDPRLLWPPEWGGFGLDAQWSERVGYYADFGTVSDLAKALRNAYVYDGCQRNDATRFVGHP